jgi:release factor glutamine methyltransferase
MLERARAFLERKGDAEARLDAELLVAHSLGLDRLRLFLELERPLDAPEVDRARDLLVRRGKGEPTAYLVGQREFYGRDFAVGPGVLVPRPETELLVDRARELAAERGSTALRVAELGTGSGCLAVTLALELPGARVVAVEISPAALEVAERNARALGAEVELRAGDGLAPLAGDRFDLLVSNPPYIDPAERATLAVEVREHEPAEALFAPAGDLDEGLPMLEGGGVLLVELGLGQADRVRRLCAERGLEPRLIDDLAGTPRVLEVAR